MRKIPTACLLCALAVALAGPAQATGYYSRPKLQDELHLVTDTNGRAERDSYIRGYIAGIAEKDAGHTWCPANKMTPGQTYDIVEKYVTAHPVPVGQSAEAVIASALGKTFPC